MLTNYNFKKLLPVSRNNNPEDIVRVSFKPRRNKGGDITAYEMMIYLGANVANKMGIGENDKVAIAPDIDNPRLIQLSRAEDGIGWTPTSLNPGYPTKMYRLQLVWKLFVPASSEWVTREVRWEVLGPTVVIEIPKPDL